MSPLIASALEIVKRTKLKLMNHNPHYGKQCCNKALRQLLQFGGITRQVSFYNQICSTRYRLTTMLRGCIVKVPTPYSDIQSWNSPTESYSLTPPSEKQITGWIKNFRHLQIAKMRASKGEPAFDFSIYFE